MDIGIDCVRLSNQHFADDVALEAETVDLQTMLNQLNEQNNLKHWRF